MAYVVPTFSLFINTFSKIHNAHTETPSVSPRFMYDNMLLYIMPHYIFTQASLYPPENI